MSQATCIFTTGPQTSKCHLSLLNSPCSQGPGRSLTELQGKAGLPVTSFILGEAGSHSCLITGGHLPCDPGQVTGSPGQSPWHLEVAPRTEHLGWVRGTASCSRIEPLPSQNLICSGTFRIPSEEPLITLPYPRSENLPLHKERSHLDTFRSYTQRASRTETPVS